MKCVFTLNVWDDLYLVVLLVRTPVSVSDSHWLFRDFILQKLLVNKAFQCDAYKLLSFFAELSVESVRYVAFNRVPDSPSSFVPGPSVALISEPVNGVDHFSYIYPVGSLPHVCFQNAACFPLFSLWPRNTYLLKAYR